MPVRSTDLAHLRDGWVRAVHARQKLARKEQRLSPAEDERVTLAVQTLKSLFPARSVPKGVPVVLTRQTNGHLSIQVEKEVLGSITDEWLSRELFAAYFAGDNVISAKVCAHIEPADAQLRDSVAAGLGEFAA